MTAPPLKHIIFIAGPIWTHVRPGIKFCARLVEKFPNSFISIYAFGPTTAQAGVYLATLSEAARTRIRIVPSVIDIPIASPLDVLLSLDKSFKPWIIEQMAITSFEVDGHVVAPPTWIIEDHINGGVSLGNGLPVVSWWAAPAASLIQHFGNPEHGHGGRLFDNILDELANQDPESQKSVAEIFYEMLSDRTVCIPGLPPFYEYEQIPQVVPSFLPLAVQFHKRWMTMREHMEIVVLCGTAETEPVAAQACTTAFTRNVRVFEAGPNVDLPFSDSASVEPDATIEFLDKAHSELGVHSVIYISFGTYFFPLPQSARHLEVILEQIVAQGFRFVFSLGSESATVGQKFIERMTEGGNAIFPKWTKQLKVLEHPAIHYFMTHGGWNSTTEAVVRNVPLIFWPFGADQCTNTMQIGHQHDCGFELFQVRTGPAKRPSYPDRLIAGTDEAVRDEIKAILTMSKGQRGKQQRINVKALGKVIRESLGKGGSGDAALEDFGKLVGL